jgi:hypothetical protein
MMSDTTSINSRNYAFQYRDGRRYRRSPRKLTWGGIRYHGIDDALYPLPNDDLEINRLDELHYCMKYIMGGNILPKLADKPTLFRTPLHRVYNTPLR